jgi:hypothetical protein
LLISAMASTARGEAFRTLIMVDASSSMRRTDPQKLRKVAAELYVDLERDGDYVSVWQFHGQATEISQGFQKISAPADRDRLKDAIRSIADDGEWTDFGAAFEAAAAAFAGVPAEPGEKRFLVFLTDGRCEPAPDDPSYLKEGQKPDRSKKAGSEREEICKQRLLSQSLPKLAGVEPIAIGLSRNAPRELLEELARRGGGRAAVTEKAVDLPHLFAAIHARNAGSRVVPATDGTVAIDPLVASLDLVVVAPGDVELEVSRPDGSTLAMDAPGLYYVRAERYRFFHLKKPEPGIWTIRPSKKLPDSAVAAIQSFDLKLRVEAPAQVEVGHPIELSVALAAGEGGGMPEESFLARHRFIVEAKAGGATRTVELAAAAGGARTGKIATLAPGPVELLARVEPGPDGPLTRVAAPVTVLAVPPLKLLGAPIHVGELKPGTKARKTLDLGASELLGKVALELKPEKLPFEIDPGKVELTEKDKTFQLVLELPEDAEAGPVKGAIALVPRTAPYEGRANGRVEVLATVVPLTFWEKHGGKTTAGLVLLLLGIVFAGIKTPARFQKKLRVYYQDKPNDDDGGDYLLERYGSGFFKPASFRIGGGGPIRRTGSLVCTLVARDGGIEIRPAPGRTLKTDEDERSGPFRASYGTRYEIEKGFVFWIDHPQDDE